MGKPADKRRSPDVVLMLIQRRRQWTNIKPTLAERCSRWEYHDFLIQFLSPDAHYLYGF